MRVPTEQSTLVVQARHSNAAKRKAIEDAQAVLLRAAIHAASVEQFAACQVSFDHYADVVNALVEPLAEFLRRQDLFARLDPEDPWSAKARAAIAQAFGDDGPTAQAKTSDAPLSEQES